MKTLINTVKCVILAITAMFLLASCTVTIKPKTLAEKEKPKQTSITAQGVAAQTQAFPQLTLLTLPDLATAQKIQKGMLFIDVENLMGPPIDCTGYIIEDEDEDEDAAKEYTYTWTLADEAGYVEVTFLLSDKIEVIDVLIKGLPEYGNNTNVQSDPAEGSLAVLSGTEPELFITDCAWYGDNKERVSVSYEFMNPMPVDIGFMINESYLNGEEFSGDDISLNLSAEAKSIDKSSFMLYKQVKPDDILVIKGALINRKEYYEIGTAEFTILFGTDSAQIESSKIIIPFDTINEGLEITYAGYVQEEEYVKVYFNYINSNPFSIYLFSANDATVYFNGEELSRLDWYASAELEANSTEQNYVKIYKIVKPGDNIKVCVQQPDLYTGKMEVIVFEATILGITIPVDD